MSFSTLRQDIVGRNEIFKSTPCSTYVPPCKCVYIDCAISSATGSTLTLYAVDPGSNSGSDDHFNMAVLCHWVLSPVAG